MKTRHLFFSLLAGMALGACSSNDVLEPDVQNVVGDQSYVSIRLVTAGGLDSRGKASANNFEYGTDNENTVKAITFYFFNEDGTFNQHSVNTEEITWTKKTAGSENVEAYTNAIAVLRNLKQKGFPEYVVAVLNDVDAAYKDLTLDQLQAKLLTSYKNETNGFIMTNSTYNNGVEGSNYFGTPIDDEMFLKEKPKDEDFADDNSNTVTIYVERLACKVKVGLGEKLTLSGTDKNEILLGSYEVDGKSRDITIKVLNWGLNATNKNTFVMKNVPAWNYSLGEFIWSDSNNFRSYWAKSPNYNGGTYPDAYDPSIELDELALNYVSWNSLGKKIGDIDYCMENTNTATVLTAQNFKSAVTHVLLTAQISDGTDLVRSYGKLYTADHYVELIVGMLANKPWKVVDGGRTTIETTDVEIINTYNGTVTVGLTEAAKGLTWYADAESTTPLTEEKIAAIDDELRTDGKDADYYNDGKMYYWIPIEHLRGGQYKYTADADGALSLTVNEADYGVVRNHYYKLSINSIANLGTAVYNPDEAIIPNPEEQTYYVGATLNILSWKVVDQNVDL